MKTTMQKTVVLIGLLTASCLLCLGQGAMTFSTRSTFESAITGLAGDRRDVNFDGPWPPGGEDWRDGTVRYWDPLTLSGLTFHAGVLVLRTTSSIPTYNRILGNFDGSTPVVIDMNGSARAFAADFSLWENLYYTSFTATVSLDTGDEFSFTALARPGQTFFGFVTSRPFSRVMFSDGGLMNGSHGEVLDTVTAVLVPEPSTLALCAFGALLLGARCRRKSRQS